MDEVLSFNQQTGTSTLTVHTLLAKLILNIHYAHKHFISYFTEIKHPMSLTRIIMYTSTEMHCLFTIASPHFSMEYKLNAMFQYLYNPTKSQTYKQFRLGDYSCHAWVTACRQCRVTVDTSDTNKISNNIN